MFDFTGPGWVMTQSRNPSALAAWIRGHARARPAAPAAPRRRARPLSAVLAPGCLRVGVGADDAELVADRCWALGATAVGEIGVGARGRLRHRRRRRGRRRRSRRPAARARGRGGRRRPGPRCRPGGVDGRSPGPCGSGGCTCARRGSTPTTTRRRRGSGSWSSTPPGPSATTTPARRLCLEAVADAGRSRRGLGARRRLRQRRAGRRRRRAGRGAGGRRRHRPGRGGGHGGRGARNGVAVDGVDAGRWGRSRAHFDLVAGQHRRRRADRPRARHRRPRRAGRDASCWPGSSSTRCREVAAAYEAEGLELADVGERDGWASPVFLREIHLFRCLIEHTVAASASSSNQGAPQ